MKIKIPGTPVGRNMLVKMDEHEGPVKTKAGIQLPTTSVTPLSTGTVVAIGRLAAIPHEVKDWPFSPDFGIGSRLLLLDGVQSEVAVPGLDGRFMLVDDSDIALVLNEEPGVHRYGLTADQMDGDVVTVPPLSPKEKTDDAKKNSDSN